ncbi:uncharacterized protein MICPUCDRAFT_58965 [Micromonas pusilla CCMP1545]|uniref:Predicted protein n=1 Tax=Micromonas pusilla (strain CCMP1545) TaxID=564608 RepID=C1MUX2_MICPC|nr:uncharacterized protein MICPUCDRAFT_58965 [Micromonas pusilla CCMP1545]EEH56708.1 predicted protein [Micromonas pusilla CCMP1545]|eukprot:XP_003059576.1 predicted protein [Micromonas pusilla CCMP1545]
MRVHIKPRVQKDKWSLYWKTSMATKTLYLDEFDIDVDPEKTTGKELRALVAETIGHQPEKELCRLESFVEPWELACAPFPMHKGRELDDDKTLAENKITTEGADVICVRKELIAEGWKILQQDDEDSDTEEEDF